MDNEVFKKYINKYKNMTEEEMRDYLKKGKMRKYERLNYAYVRVHMLLDFMNIIDKHASELKSPGSVVVVESGKKIRPSQTIYEYIILEITSFYNLVREIKEEENLSLPELPDYWRTIIDFRNQITGHLDKEGRLKTVREWVEKYEEVDQIGVEKIIFDFNKAYWECHNLLKGNI